MVVYALHVAYLFRRGKFDYGYSMAANLFVTMIQLGILLLWAVRPTLFPHGYVTESLPTNTYASPPLVPEDTIELTSYPEGAHSAASCTTVAAPLSATPLARSSSAHRRQFDLQAVLDQSSSSPPSSPSPLSHCSDAAMHCSTTHWPINVQSLSQRRRRAAYLAFGMLLASALELWDFPPLKRALDAHALLHASTIPLSIL